MKSHGGLFAALLEWLIIAAVVATVLKAAAPALVRLAHAAVPLVLAVGGVLIVLRLIARYTDRF